MDDDEGALKVLTEHISQIPNYTIVFSTDNQLYALDAVFEKKIDILITDVSMPGFSGLELAKRILHLDIPLILCSAYDEYCLEGYKVNAIYFIRKTPQFLDVSEALQKARLKLDKFKPEPPPPPAEEDVVVIKLQGDSKQVILRTREIHFLEQQEVSTIITLDSGEKLKTRSRFSVTLEKIKRPFIFRTHRSFAVNYLKIKSFDSASCLMVNGHIIPVGKEYRKTFSSYLESKTFA
ncbi:LytR/AlgR family response regulator transcription factor [Algoriphagus aquaeductus]|uniref:LytR/AlgR family response regulator transcription factor n=1 Tax=Algoriphagus aquaeductus TaxID=475299 RepID=UPI0015EBB722|nr:LytTR family DNA-binding domain-containing protein [Algoriphagus aquaeductus]